MNTDLTAQEANERMRKHQEEHNRDDVYIGMLAKCNAQIAELQAELERLRSAINAKGGNEHSPTQFAYDQACKALREKIEELERLRASVPEDVGKAICRYFQSAIYGAHFGDYSRAENDEKELLALIGSLIERKREDIKQIWLDGYGECEMEESAIQYELPALRAKAYAERKMQEGK